MVPPAAGSAPMAKRAALGKHEFSVVAFFASGNGTGQGIAIVQPAHQVAVAAAI